jgi:hypothetical protein
MRNNLFEFLFGLEAASASSQTLGEDVVKLFEEAAGEETEQMVANKKPLAAALKEIGISSPVAGGPQGCEIQCADEAEYRDHMALLANADNMHKLAQLGWVATQCGDQAMGNEPPGFKIGFIELSMLGMPDNDQKAEPLETVIKNARQFATTPMAREDDSLNPVESGDKTSDDRQKGVGKAGEGAAPKGKIKDSLAARRLAAKMLDEMTGVSAVPALDSPPLGMVSGIPPRRERPEASDLQKERLRRLRRRLNSPNREPRLPHS